MSNECHPDSGRFCNDPNLAFESVGIECFSQETQEMISDEILRLQHKWGIKAKVVVNPGLGDILALVEHEVDKRNILNVNPDFEEMVVRDYVNNSDFRNLDEPKDAITHEYGHVLNYSLDDPEDILRTFAAMGARPRVLAEEIALFLITEVILERVAVEAVADAFLQYEKGIPSRWADATYQTFKEKYHA